MPDPTPVETHPIGPIAGAIAVITNIAGVVVLSQGVGSAYRVDEMQRWIDQIRAAPDVSQAAAVLFWVGCAALIPFGWAVGRFLGGGPLARAGATAVGAAAICNLVGCFSLTEGTALLASGGDTIDAATIALQRAIALDAAFNFAFGVGLVLLGFAARPTHRWLGVASIITGVLLLPVTLQFTSGAAARWLAVAGPAWLLLVTAWSVVLWRRRR